MLVQPEAACHFPVTSYFFGIAEFSCKNLLQFRQVFACTRDLFLNQLMLIRKVREQTVLTEILVVNGLFEPCVLFCALFCFQCTFCLSRKFTPELTYTYQKSLRTGYSSILFLLVIRFWFFNLYSLSLHCFLFLRKCARITLWYLRKTPTCC